MPFRVDCPYCNSTTTIAEPLAKATCGRCGETFAPAAYHNELNEFPPSALTPVKPKSASGWIIAALMLLLIAGGVTAYLLTKQTPPKPPIPPAAPPTTMPPSALAGLRHLPAAANILIAIQPAAVAAHAERTGTDVKALLGSFGVPASVWDALEKAGVSPSDIDHLAAGVVLKGALPEVVLVLKLRQPPDRDLFLRKLKADKKPKAGPALYSAGLAGMPVTLLPVNDTTFLFGVFISDDDLVKLSQQLKPDFAALKPALTERLSPASFAWLATDTRPWGEVELLKLEMLKKYGTKLAPLRSASIGLSLEPDPTLKVMLDLADAAAATQCVDALTKLNLDAATVVADGATVKLIAAATPATLEKLLAVVK